MQLESNLGFRRKHIPGDMRDKHRDPEARTSLECSKTARKLVGLELMEPRQSGRCSWRVVGARSGRLCEPLQGIFILLRELGITERL